MDDYAAWTVTIFLGPPAMLFGSAFLFHPITWVADPSEDKRFGGWLACGGIGLFLWLAIGRAWGLVP